MFFSQGCINQNFYTMNNLCYSNHLCTGNNVKVKVTADIITVISLYAWLSFRIFIDLAHGHVLWLDENMRKSPREEDRLQSALVHVTPIHMYTCTLNCNSSLWFKLVRYLLNCSLPQQFVCHVWLITGVFKYIYDKYLCLETLDSIQCMASTWFLIHMWLPMYLDTCR